MNTVNHFVVMGTTGCGKSTVAQLLASRFQSRMIEADDLHSPANIEKMSCGEALTDEDRHPWLLSVARQMQMSQTPVFVSCSALRLQYRHCLRKNARVPIGFVHLQGSREVISQRLCSREDHFMPLSLLDSQLSLLEPLVEGEIGTVVDISRPLEEIEEVAARFVIDQRC